MSRRLASLLLLSSRARGKEKSSGSDVISTLSSRALFSSSAAAAFSSRPPLPLPTSASELARAHGASTPALVDSLTGRVTTFSRLEATARDNARELRRALGGGLFDENGDKTKNVDKETGARASGPRIAVLGPPSPDFAAALWGVWSAGGCVVPLHHAGVPEASMAAALSDVGASAVVFPPSSTSSSPSFEERAASLVALSAKTADANGKMLPAVPVCLPWSQLSGGEEFRGEGGEGEGDDDEDENVDEDDDGELTPSSSSSNLSRGALVVFTSGTTGRPKPALHSHLSLRAQASSLREAWELQGGGTGERRRRLDNNFDVNDVVYNSLPWHHVHGLINALIAPLAAGCAVEVAPGFSPAAAWRSLCRGRRGERGVSFSSRSPSSSSDPPSFVPFKRPVTVFMGVPTMYSHLLTSLEGGGSFGGTTTATTTTFPPPSRDEAAAAAAALRLSICGSAACPVPLARAWDELVERGKKVSLEAEGAGAPDAPPPPPSSLSSSSLLERYGMTEAGMVLGQSLRGLRLRGVVGRPMPGVEVRLRKLREGEEEKEVEKRNGNDDDDDDGEVDSLDRDEKGSTLPPATGELLVRWPGMFSAYWGRRKATKEAFMERGGWFATGDVAARGGFEENDDDSPFPNSSSYRLLGRASVDILKVSGEKVSALEVEDALLSHEAVAEAAVVALDGGVRGDAVGAVLVAKKTKSTKDALPTLEEIRSFTSGLLTKAAVPTKVAWVDSLPRNAMGKVDKRRAREEAFPANDEK